MATFETITAAGIGGGGGGGVTIYSGDGTLAGNRIVDLDGKTLVFNQGGNSLISLNPLVYETIIASSDNTGVSRLTLYNNVVGGDVYFELQANDGVNSVYASGDSVAQTLTLTAANGVIVANNNFQITTPKTPASAAATGTIGQIAWDASFIYVCVNTNTWKRVAIATW